MNCPTVATLSRAAKAKMSAQETVCGHWDSSWDLASSIISKPRNKGLPGRSLSKSGFCGVLSRSIDASQPCHVYY